MGRNRRPNLPGVIFHLTARTLQKERLFTPAIRRGALADLVRVAPASQCRILAVAIMSNHLHLVVQQGGLPLERLMQPLLCRLARRTQRTRDRDGPVFWRHYSAVACLDPWHARNAIVYVHLNPVRAGICGEPSRYPWTSHDLYALAPDDLVDSECQCLRSVIDPGLGLPLFATTRDRSGGRLRDDYLAFIERRLAMDRLGLDPDPAGEDTWPGRPVASWEGGSWGAALSPLFHSPVRAASDGRGLGSPAPDMTTIARNVLAFEAPDVPLELIRNPGAGRRRSRLRDAIIRRLHDAGYRNHQIARFLCVSTSTVSNAVRRDRGDGTG
jgi:REP element-mobilizing transposase RayT